MNNVIKVLLFVVAVILVVGLVGGVAMWLTHGAMMGGGMGPGMMGGGWVLALLFIMLGVLTVLLFLGRSRGP